MKEKRKNNNKKKQNRQIKTKEEAGTGSIVNEWELNDFFAHLS